MTNQKEKTLITVQISYKNLFLCIALVLLLYTIFLIRDILIGLFISILFATALNPLVTMLEKRNLPRPLAAFIVYGAILTSLVVLAATVIPPLVMQTNSLLGSLALEEAFAKFNLFDFSVDSWQAWTSRFGSVMPFVRAASSTFSGLVALFSFAVITFYLLVERNNLHRYIAKFVKGHNKEIKVERIITQMEAQIGSWVRGQLALMVVVGLITYVGLKLLGVPYALPLAIFAGLLEIIPNIGPTISAIPAVLIPLVFGLNPVTALFVLALYVLVQQLENNFIVPNIMRTAIGLHPLVTILLIIVGLKLAGVAGAILSVPLFLVLKVFYVEYGREWLDKSVE